MIGQKRRLGESMFRWPAGAWVLGWPASARRTLAPANRTVIVTAVVGCLLVASLLLEPRSVPADSKARARLNDKQKVELMISRLEQAALYSRSDAFLEEFCDAFRSSRSFGEFERATEVVRGFFHEVRPLGSDPLIVFGAPEVLMNGSTAVVRVQTLLSGWCKGGDAVCGLSATTLHLAKENGLWRIAESDDLMGLMTATLVAQEPGLASRYSRCWETMTVPRSRGAH